MKISVALCTYNGEEFIAEQLDSIAAQTKKIDEIVCCDDGSTDRTIEILEVFSRSFDGKFVLINNPTQLGARKNFEKALGLCTGDIIFLSDQDDAWMPGKIASMHRLFEEMPDILGVFCNGWLVSESGQDLKETIWDALYFEPDLRDKIKSENLLYYLLINGNIATGTAMGIRKQALEKIFPFFCDHSTWHDHWIALVLSALNRLVFIDEPLLFYRVHANQQVGFQGRGRSNEQFRDAVRQTWLNTSDPDPQGVKTIHLAWALQAYERYLNPLTEHVGTLPHIIQTGKRIEVAMNASKRSWIGQKPWPKKKMKLLKHWLKGGEYLRIRFIDLLKI